MENLRQLLNPNTDGEGGPPLAVLYSRCHAVHCQQDHLLASRDTDLIDSAINLLLRTQSLVESLGIFSSNEDRDDLATADIKYLLMSFYLGSLVSAAPARTVGAVSASAPRLGAVNRAASALGAFLQRCEQYDLLGALGRTAYESVATGAPLDPATKRSYKVDKFKREKALNAALGALEARRLSAAAQEREDEEGLGGLRAATDGSADAATSATANAVATGAAAGGGGGGIGLGGGRLDEEDERQLWVWRVELAVLQALDVHGALKQEMELLQHAAAREAAAAAAGPGPSSSSLSRDARGGDGGDQNGGPSEAEKAELMARLRSICRDLDGNRRGQMRQDVFKPSHTLPTLTVEEAGEIERREAMEREERQKRQEEKERQRRAALDSDEEDAEDKAKQRAWDDWKDSHPKGYGNSKLRPCG